MITFATLGRRSTQLIATWGTVLPVSFGDRVQGVHDPEQVLVSDGRAAGDRVLVAEPARLGQGLAAADLARQPREAERAPRDAADALVECQRHELPLIVAADERIVRLVGDIPRQPVFLRYGQRFHQVPAGEVRAADVADLAGPDQVVKRAKRLLDRRRPVEGVELVEVDVVGAQPLSGSPRRRGSDGIATIRRSFGPGPTRNADLVEMITRRGVP